MKLVPNFISFSRIIFSLTLIFLRPLSTAFYTIYIICGLSDIIDGYIARKTGEVSNFGARLDSMADMVMDCILIFILYPIISPSTEIIIWIVLIAVVRLISIRVAFKKYKTFASIHTYGNKITGIALFMFPMLISYASINVLIYIICFMASISAIEELVIQLTSSELKVNRKSIFIK